MNRQIKETLADEPVNTGRQLEVDIGKASMILMLPFIHCIIECSTDAQFDYGIFYITNTARYLIPYFVGYGITGDREHFIEPLIFKWLGCDVLLFA